MSQMAIRWCLDHDAVSVVIPGAKNPGQARANVAAAEIPPLSAELHKNLSRWYSRNVAGLIRGPY